MGRLFSGSILLIVLAATVSFVMYSQNQYDLNTTPEERQRHLEVAKELEGLKQGDFIELSDRRLGLVSGHAADKKRILVRFYVGQQPQNAFATYILARNVKRIIRVGGDDWAKKAEEYLVE